MDAISQLDYPAPVIAADVSHIRAETPAGFSGRFRLTNLGGGELRGSVSSNSGALSFSPADFAGNSVEIEYTFSMDFFRPGEVVESRALILSNGGELSIPVTIAIAPPELAAEDGKKLASLSDYSLYAKENPVASRRLFTRKEFLMWLLNMNYEQIELYERFAADPNKERAVDNFLILNKLKEKAGVEFSEKNLKVRLRYNENGPVTAYVPLRMTGWGYLNAGLRLRGGVGFLRLGAEKLSSADFDEKGCFAAPFAVYPALIKGRGLNAAEYIELSGAGSGACRVTVIRERIMTCSLSETLFGPRGKGRLIIENNSGKDVKIGVFTKDAFVRFEGRRYIIGARAEIPFEIRLPAALAARMALKKRSLITSGIFVRAESGPDFSKEFEIKIGSVA